jgi:hypothetical protein
MTDLTTTDHLAPLPPVGVETFILVTDMRGNVYRWPLNTLVITPNFGDE